MYNKYLSHIDKRASAGDVSVKVPEPGAMKKLKLPKVTGSSSSRLTKPNVIPKTRFKDTSPGHDISIRPPTIKVK